MKFYLKKHEAAGDGIRRINRALCRHVHRLIDDESLDADTAVHELRKCVKKLRAVLRFSKPALQADVLKRTDRALRDFARRFSGTRDSAVMVKSFDSLMKHYQPYLNEDEMLPVRQSLQQRHVLAMASHQEEADPDSLRAAFRQVERLLKQAGKASMSRTAMLSGVRDVYARGRRLYFELAQDPSTDNSHELRRQAKYLLYQLTLLARQLPSGAQPLIDELGELGELLGDDNDMSVLVDTLNRNPLICCNRVRAELIASLAETRRIALLTAALRLSQRIYRHKPGRFIRELESGA